MNQLESFNDQWRRDSKQSPCLDTHFSPGLSEPAARVGKALNTAVGARMLYQGSAVARAAGFGGASMTSPALARIVFALAVSIPWLTQALPWSGGSQPANTTPQNPLVSTPQSMAAKVPRQKPAPPALALGADNLNPPRGQPVRFTAAWNRDMPQMVYRFDWGDGQAADTQEPAADHTYASEGSYTVRLTARPVKGTAAQLATPIASNELSIKVVAQPPTSRARAPAAPRSLREPLQRSPPAESLPPQVPLPPVVLTLAADNLAPEPRQSVRFTGSWNTRVSRVLYRFEWGDGQRTDSKTSQADHAYSAPGVYTVRLVATAAITATRGSAQQITSNELLINVQPVSEEQQLPPAVLKLAADNANPLPGETVRFTATWNRDMPPFAYRFDWGDGQTFDTKVPQADHAYLGARCLHCPSRCRPRQPSHRGPDATARYRRPHDQRRSTAQAGAASFSTRPDACRRHPDP